MQKSMGRLYPHAFINMWLRYGRAPRPYRVKCCLVLKFSDKTRKTSCISGSMRHHRLVNPTGSGFNSLSSLIQLFRDPLTAELCVTRSLPRHLLSAAECDAVGGAGATFGRTRFALSHTHTRRHTTAWVFRQPSDRCRRVFVRAFFSAVLPCRKTKSLWASVSCLRCSVTETWRRMMEENTFRFLSKYFLS